MSPALVQDEDRLLEGRPQQFDANIARDDRSPVYSLIMSGNWIIRALRTRRGRRNLLLGRWSPFRGHRFVFISGFHHSGTTLLQSVLRAQGVFTLAEEGPPGLPDRPMELRVNHIRRILHAAGATERTWAMTKWPTQSSAVLEETIYDLRLFAPACTLVICLRDPAAVALSLAGRYGEWNADRALADAQTQRQIIDGWLAYSHAHRGRVVPVPLEDFTTDPQRFVRRILRIRPTDPLPTSIKRYPQIRHSPKGNLPDPALHDERRHQQAHTPVYLVGRDDWMQEADPPMLPTLYEIRARFGTSPSVESIKDGLATPGGESGRGTL
ncbi:MAG: hypothetical protein OXK76_12020 [Gammaproteobacteria bacterium]|nr:hypothetical protein [Gammaproteobacteria bacterium]